MNPNGSPTDGDGDSSNDRGNAAHRDIGLPLAHA
jgi:hypothetical protein